MTAVVAGAPGRFQPAPDHFPHESINGVTSARTTSRLDGSSDNNFATLQFTQASGQINVRVQHFYIRNSGAPEPGKEVNIPLWS
jgi:hypothetical protein